MDEKGQQSCAQVGRAHASIQSRCSSQAGVRVSLRLGCVSYVACRVPESSITLDGMSFKYGAVVKRPLLLRHWVCFSQSRLGNMEEYELDYDVQEVRLSEEHVFKVTTVANEALPLEMLLDLETRRYREQSTKHHTAVE